MSRNNKKMKTIKVLSIIGLAWLSIFFIFMLIDNSEGNYGPAIGSAIWGLLYALAFTIVVLVQSIKKSHYDVDLNNELIKLGELREKNILTEEEFKSLKITLLKKVK